MKLLVSNTLCIKILAVLLMEEVDELFEYIMREISGDYNLEEDLNRLLW